MKLFLACLLLIMLYSCKEVKPFKLEIVTNSPTASQNGDIIPKSIVDIYRPSEEKDCADVFSGEGSLLRVGPGNKPCSLPIKIDTRGGYVTPRVGIVNSLIDKQIATLKLGEEFVFPNHSDSDYISPIAKYLDKAKATSIYCYAPMPTKIRSVSYAGKQIPLFHSLDTLKMAITSDLCMSKAAEGKYVVIFEPQIPDDNESDTLFINTTTKRIATFDGVRGRIVETVNGFSSYEGSQIDAVFLEPYPNEFYLRIGFYESKQNALVALDQAISRGYINARILQLNNSFSVVVKSSEQHTNISNDYHLYQNRFGKPAIVQFRDGRFFDINPLGR